MSIPTILIKNGTVINFDGQQHVDILCEGGKITKMEKIDEKEYKNCHIIDASSKFIIPGGIDPHTHMDMPFMGTKTCDDFYSGTRAALAGGTTMLIDFIIPGKAQRVTEAMDIWSEKAKRAVCDYSFHCAITAFNDQVSKDMEELVKRGINSFKHFMAYKNAIMIDEENMIRSFARCRELGVLPSVHAENGELVANNQKRLVSEGVIQPEGHALSRDSSVEGEAANRACVIAAQLNVPLLIVHNTCKEAINAIQRSREAGNRVFAEATISHLVLDESKYFKDFKTASHHVLSPPLRSKEHVDYLWKMVQSNDINYVCTDHCSFNTKQKAAGEKNFCLIPNGIPAVEERNMLLWTYGVNTGKITKEQFVAMTSTTAAHIYNIYPQKGKISVGSDADIVVWDPQASKTISAAFHNHANDFNVFEGTKVTGCPSIVLTGGRLGYSDGKVISPEGSGKFIPRKPFSPVVFDGYNLRERETTIKRELYRKK